MARFDARCDADIPVSLLAADSHEKEDHGAVLTNLGLGGAFIRSGTRLPEHLPVVIRARVPGFGVIEAPAEVIRQQPRGVGLRFVGLDRASKTVLWNYVRGHLEQESACPYCGTVQASDDGNCRTCRRNLDFSAARSLSSVSEESLTHYLHALDTETERFIMNLSELEEMSATTRREILVRKLAQGINSIFQACTDVEQALGDDRSRLKDLQVDFRNRTHGLVSKSHLYNHARTWPLGYPGDYRMIESVYRNIPLSSGLGLLLDQYFLTTTLAHAVRERKARMGELLETELSARTGLRVLNIGCGPSREIVELSALIHSSNAVVTCVDADNTALEFAAERMQYTPAVDQVRFRRYNALRMVNAERNRKQFGEQDIVYTIGLLDYLEDDVLVRMLGALYNLLRPEGKLIAVFKDGERYETADYHWMADWDAFLQRTASHSRKLFAAAGIPDLNIEISRDRSGVMIFYVVTKQ